jgi:hypothetical protein
MYNNFCLDKKGNVRMYKRNVDARSFNHCCSERAISITYSEFVFVALGSEHAVLMRRIFYVWPARLYSIFLFHIISKTA